MNENTEQAMYLVMTYSTLGRPTVVARATTAEEGEQRLLESAQLNPGTRYNLRAPDGELLGSYEEEKTE